MTGATAHATDADDIGDRAAASLDPDAKKEAAICLMLAGSGPDDALFDRGRDRAGSGVDAELGVDVREV